ncbi:MAG: 5'-nucleotidase C-terminal domain-containing protein, partial [Nocardioides sp.]
NYNVIDFFDATVPFAASDHNPELIGINVPAIEPASREIQILATNDFHGRILNNTSNGEAGAAVLSGAVKQLRAANPDTVFAAAGDLIGASTFESFIQRDKPTIDALNEAGLEVSAAGNHEFDQGYDDLVNRVMAPYDATTNPLGGARWKYIAANVRKKSDNTHALPESWMQTFGSVKVGFVGAVTEDLPSLVSPAGISSIAVTDIVDEANTTADDLEAAGADVIVLLVHEGAAATGIASATDSSPFGQIVNGVDTNIDAIVSGHTHLAYNHAVTVPAWVSEGRAVTTRPVVSAGQYGTALNQLKFTVDTATGAVTAKTQGVLNLKTGQTANYPVDLPTKAIVDSAVSRAAVLGAVELGKIAGPFSRAKMSNGTTENRGGESTLGNLVAEVQQWATEAPEAGAAQIAFMNPGGLRDDMIGNPGGYPATLTYRQAANVQSFANTLVNMRLTGAQIKTVLEQQWQPSGAARPFLRLGTSEGFRFTYDPTRASGARITGISLNGTAIDPAASYSVTVNSFLASGGDNFFEFANGTQKRDTGKVDLQAMVDYLDEFANTAEGDVPLPVSYQQHAVGASYPTGQPTSYAAGGAFDVDLSSLVFSAPTDLKDTSVDVRLDGRSIGSFPVDNTLGTVISDEYGKALVRATIPADTNEGPAVVLIVGNNTGTSLRLPIEVTAGVDTAVTGTDSTITWPQAGSVPVQVTPSGASGTVTLLRGDQALGSTTLSGGVGSIALPAKSLDPGTYRLSLQYGGGEGFRPATGFVTVTVLKADPQLTVLATPHTLQVRKDLSTVAIDVVVPGYTPTGFVAVYADGTLQRVVELSGGTAGLAVGPFGTVGTKVLSVRYLGDEFTAAETSTDVLIKVQKGRVRD